MCDEDAVHSPTLRSLGMSGNPVVWKGHPVAPAPVRAILAARQRGESVVDDVGHPIRIGWCRILWESVRAVGLRAGCVALGIVARVLSSRAAPAVRRDGASHDGPVVLVVPVLPDTSHTFVYREALALLALRPDWRCIVLAQEPRAPRHREAQELAAKATFLPRRGVAARLLCVARWLFSRRGRELFSLYRAAEHGSCNALLNKRALVDGRDPGNAFELADLLRPMRPKHVHVYSSTHPTNVAMGAAHLLAVPFSISSYVDFEFDYSHKLLAEKFARATFFRVVSQFCFDRLSELLALDPIARSRIHAIDLGIDLDAWPMSATRQGGGVLVSVARLVPKKGLHLIPPLLAQLRAEGIPFTWQVVGDGPDRDRIVSLCRQHGVEDSVHFLGAKDSATVRGIVAAADIAILPCVLVEDGERDGIPVFLAEAMALGTPCLSAPVAGIPELIEHGKTGFLCESKDSKALYDLLRRLLLEPDLARSVTAAARAKVETKFNVRATSAQLLARIEA